MNSNEPWETGYFQPPSTIGIPSQQLQGRLLLNTQQADGQIQVQLDAYDVTNISELNISRLPEFDFQYIQDGSDVIPVQRGAQAGNHPYWEWILEPGKAWDDPNNPDWTRVSLPFSLQERNQNCTHHGMMTFQFRADGSVSLVNYQVGSETCKYLKINLWGSLAAEYQPGPVPGTKRLIENYRRQVSSRMPVKPMQSIASDYPDINPEAFNPPGLEDVTIHGLVVDGVHYRGECMTRFGPYPFCNVLDLPSYSLAKSIFAGLVFIYLENAYPGFADILVADLVPECRLEDRRWQDVTMRHLLNMSTGNYDDAAFEADEGASNVGDFFLPETHAEKISFSCTAYQRKSPPGTQFVYHTFDTYILGTAMNTFLQQTRGRGADIFDDVLMAEVLAPLNLSPTAGVTRRTFDEIAQAFTGYGLTWNPDDIARIAQWLNQEIEREDKNPLLRGIEFRTAMFRNQGFTRLLNYSRGDAYSNGFWGLDIAKQIGCNSETWIPFMSGYGGNVVALIPNGSVYYYFSDGDQFKWSEAASETQKIKDYCKNNDIIQ